MLPCASPIFHFLPHPLFSRRFPTKGTSAEERGTIMRSKRYQSNYCVFFFFFITAKKVKDILREAVSLATVQHDKHCISCSQKHYTCKNPVSNVQCNKMLNCKLQEMWTLLFATLQATLLRVLRTRVHNNSRTKIAKFVRPPLQLTVLL